MLDHARASIFEGPGLPLQLRNVALPALGDGEMLVRVRLATICGSDLHSFDGKRTVPCPTILGHEILGTIEEMGPGAEVDISGRPLALGDRVTWSLVVACGQCFSCRHQLPEKCAYVRKYGHERISDAWALNGGLATHCHLLKRTAVFRVPDALPDTVACPASCATATVAAAMRHAGNLADQVVLIQGAGMLGLTAAAWARVNGARAVIVCDVSAGRLEVARTFGADAVFTPDGQELRQFVSQASEGRGVDVAIDMSGSGAAITLGIDLLRCGGRAIWVGAVFPSQVNNFVAERVVRKYLSIQGVHNYQPTDLATALDFLTAHHHKFPFADQVSRPFPLEQCQAAFDHARSGASFRVAVSSD